VHKPVKVSVSPFLGQRYSPLGFAECVTVGEDVGRGVGTSDGRDVFAAVSGTGMSVSLTGAGVTATGADVGPLTVISALLTSPFSQESQRWMEFTVSMFPSPSGKTCMYPLHSTWP